MTHTLYDGKVSYVLGQATSNTGLTVVVFRTSPDSGQPQGYAVVQRPGEQFGAPMLLSAGPVVRPTVLSWGDGNVSVVWESPAGTNNWSYHLRTVASDGSWGATQDLLTAQYAYTWFQAAINSTGEVALSWSNGDNTDRVAIRHQDGSWTRPPPVPVVHPTSGGYVLIANPRALFLDDAGRVSDITWGSLGAQGRALWLMRLDAQGAWQGERIAPTGDATLSYTFVSHAHFSADAKGDIAVVAVQQPATGARFATIFRYRPAGGTFGANRQLSPTICEDDLGLHTCADVAVAGDGSALMTYLVKTGSDYVVRVVRRATDGTYSKAETVSEAFPYVPRYGVDLASNAKGDGLVSFDGGTKKVVYTEFARCPAAGQCELALRRDSGPNWMLEWFSTVGPSGGNTVSWVTFNGQQVITRRLAPLGG